MTTGYILVGIYFEERDLQNAHPEYADYKRTTPMFVPHVGNKAAATSRSADGSKLSNTDNRAPEVPEAV